MSAHDWLAGSGRRRTQTVMARIGRQVRMRQEQLFLVGTVLCAASLLTTRLDHGWFHHDDGSLAHSAQRVLAGDLPHRDFADLYTGLLSFINAAVFALAGEDIFNLRVPLFILFLAFTGCFFALARRLVSPVWAFFATLFAITWSVPVYPAPMPSWYLLFLSTFGLYAVVRFFETNQHRWLFLAGSCGGIAVAIKVVGVWYVVAIVLALLARPLLDDAEPRSRQVRSSQFAALVASAALLAFGLVVAVMSRRLAAPELVGLLLPITAVCGAVALLGWRASAGLSRSHVFAVLGQVAAFLAGVCVPLALFVAPYVLTGSVGVLFEGVFITPQSRFEFASFSMPHPATLLWAVPVIALFDLRRRVDRTVRNRIDVAAGTVMVFLAMTATDVVSYSVIWRTTRGLAPFVIALGALAILRRGQGPTDLPSRVVLPVVLVGAFSTLLQFPFAAPVYFCYAAPLVLLAAIAGMRTFGLVEGLLPGVVLIALVVFGARQLDHQSVLSLGVGYESDPGVAIIDDERASIRVRPEVKEAYDRVRGIVARHSRDGHPIFAGPDAPEIYFLTRSPNPTPSILDFLDSSGTTRGERLISVLRKEDVHVVVLNHSPLQSPALALPTIERIRSMYRRGVRVQQFEVRWNLSD